MVLVVIVVAIALIFDFVNGFHDAANSIATIVATRVLKPWQAVIWAATFNFISFLILPLTVADAIAKIVSPDVASIGLVFAGLAGAIFWNVLTAWLGLPSSAGCSGTIAWPACWRQSAWPSSQRWTPSRGGS